MADVVTPAVRSRMMAGIRGKNTKPELILRRGLHRLGFRYQLHRSDLPGKPDLVFPRHRAVLLAQGCFWHGHGCHLFKWPKSRALFWREKIGENRVRDLASIAKLRATGWRVGQVWECALKGRGRHHSEEVIQSCAEWLLSSENALEISGCETRASV
jgi:DNA mismatch endonuclease (patch repair protein)